MKSCAAYNCHNVFDKASSRTYHKFPLKNESLCAEWVKQVRRENFKPTQYHCLCSDHFEEDCFLPKYVNRRQLKDGCVPTIFNFPEHLVKTPAGPRNKRLQTELQPEPENVADLMDATDDLCPSAGRTQPGASNASYTSPMEHSYFLNPSPRKMQNNSNNILMPAGVSCKVVHQRGPPNTELKLRLQIHSKEEFNGWLAEFQKKSGATFRVLRTRPFNGKYVKFKGTYRCHRNTVPQLHSTKKPAAKHTGCPVTMDVTIKVLHARNRSKDKYLSTHPTVVCLKGEHNHLINTPSELKFRDVSDKVRNRFCHFFSAGLSPIEAMKMHQLELMEEHGDDYTQVKVDRAICPDKKWVYRLYYSMSANRVRRNVPQDLLTWANECQMKGQAVGAGVIPDGFYTWLRTPLMDRVHSLPTSGERMYLKVSSRQDCELVMMLVDSPVGKLPLGALVVNSGADAKMIMAALKNFLDSLSPGAFGGQKFPSSIVVDSSLEKCCSAHSGTTLESSHVTKRREKKGHPVQNGTSLERSQSVYCSTYCDEFSSIAGPPDMQEMYSSIDGCHGQMLETEECHFVQDSQEETPNTIYAIVTSLDGNQCMHNDELEGNHAANPEIECNSSHPTQTAESNWTAMHPIQTCFPHSTIQGQSQTCQVAWKWLLDERNKVDGCDLLELYLSVSKTVHSSTPDAFRCAYSDVLKSPVAEKYPHWIQFLSGLHLDSLQIPDGSETMAIATAALLECHMSRQTRTMNVLDLLNFTLNDLDGYFAKHLLSIATGQLAGFQKGNLEMCRFGECLYQVKSAHGFNYVAVDAGSCDCIVGAMGHPCSHLDAVASATVANCQVQLDDEMCRKLKWIATGQTADTAITRPLLQASEVREVLDSFRDDVLKLYNQAGCNGGELLQAFKYFYEEYQKSASSAKDAAAFFKSFSGRVERGEMHKNISASSLTKERGKPIKSCIPKGQSGEHDYCRQGNLC